MKDEGSDDIHCHDFLEALSFPTKFFRKLDEPLHGMASHKYKECSKKHINSK